MNCRWELYFKRPRCAREREGENGGGGETVVERRRSSRENQQSHIAEWDISYGFIKIILLSQTDRNGANETRIKPKEKKMKKTQEQQARRRTQKKKQIINEKKKRNKCAICALRLFMRSFAKHNYSIRVECLSVRRLRRSFSCSWHLAAQFNNRAFAAIFLPRLTSSGHTPSSCFWAVVFAARVAGASAIRCVCVCECECDFCIVHCLHLPRVIVFIAPHRWLWWINDLIVENRN